VDKNGIDAEKLEFIKRIKNKKRGRIQDYVDQYPDAEYHETDPEADSNPLWNIIADCVFPCATQNEIKKKDAKNLAANGIQLLAEGANMPCTSEAIGVLQESKILYAPGKCANAGGVAVSGLEMTQNRMGVYWNRDEVDEKLKNIMKNIHEVCLRAAEDYGVPGNYLEGANIFAFLKVAEAMKAQGMV
jgi:glutamate dehydrogenase (NADP+)